MRDRCAVRALGLGLLDVDVDPLMVHRHVGEGVDAALVDVHPPADSEFLADRRHRVVHGLEHLHPNLPSPCTPRYRYLFNGIDWPRSLGNRPGPPTFLGDRWPPPHPARRSLPLPAHRSGRRARARWPTCLRSSSPSRWCRRSSNAPDWTPPTSTTSSWPKACRAVATVPATSRWISASSTFPGSPSTASAHRACPPSQSARGRSQPE